MYFNFRIKVPVFLAHIYLWFLLRYKKIRYGCELRYIFLNQGRYVIVDRADYEILSQYKWSLITNGKNSYAFRKERRKAVYMHNQILPPPSGFVVDHENHNGLDNSRENLRLATFAQNSANRRVPVIGSSKYKGIILRKDTGTWIARIGYKGERIYLGSFKAEIEAAKAYDAAARKYHGDFASLNFG